MKTTPTPDSYFVAQKNSNHCHVLRSLLNSAPEDMGLPMLFYFISKSNDSQLSLIDTHSDGKHQVRTESRKSSD
jgi:hypothetical protein